MNDTCNICGRGIITIILSWPRNCWGCVYWTEGFVPPLFRYGCFVADQIARIAGVACHTKSYFQQYCDARKVTV